jgi:hypothetical protein
MSLRDSEVMDIGDLRENLTEITEVGTWVLNGGRLSPDRKVLLCVHGHYFPLERVSITSAEGSFVLVLGSDTSLAF